MHYLLLANEIADLWISGLFSATDIGADYGISHQTVSAIGWKVEMRRRVDCMEKVCRKHGFTGSGLVPDPVQVDYERALLALKAAGKIRSFSKDPEVINASRWVIEPRLERV